MLFRKFVLVLAVAMVAASNATGVGAAGLMARDPDGHGALFRAQ